MQRNSFTKLFIFTGVTFAIYVIVGILWRMLGWGDIFVYFIGGSFLFAGSNFFYYYSVLVKGVKEANKSLHDMISADRVDMDAHVKTSILPYMEVFMGKFQKLLNGVLGKLIVSAGKTSVFNAKFNFHLKKAIEDINAGMQSFEAVNETMRDSTRAINDISKNVEEFSNFMQDVDVASNKAVDVITNVGGDIEKNVKDMRDGKKLIDELNDNIKNIQGIVGVINEIADQTNLLALNAAIEAARAGEAGRGFAVVADEVRKLAEKTQSNASEIADMINTVSDNASKLIRQNMVIAERIEQTGNESLALKETFEDLKNEISKSAQMLNDITAAVEEQSASIEEVSQTVESVTQSTKEVVSKLNDVVSQSVDLDEITAIAFSAMEHIKIDTPIEQIYQILLDGKKEIEKTIEDAIKNGEISSADIWDRNYVPVPNTNPQKHKTRFTNFFKRKIQPIEDKLLSSHPQFVFVAAVDDHGYLPAHNSIYDKPLTGDYEKDLVGNRSMRIFDDKTGLAAAQNTKKILVQTYMRDTGEAMHDISVPLYVEGRHWGGLRSGVRP